MSPGFSPVFVASLVHTLPSEFPALIISWRSGERWSYQWGKGPLETSQLQPCGEGVGEEER